MHFIIWKWTRACLSISCFLSFMYPSKNVAKNVDKWTSFKNSEYLNGNFMYFIFHVCTVDKELSIYFILSFYLVPFSFYSKSVDRGTSSENSEELMAIACVSLFKSVEIWARSCFFHFLFFYLVPFKSFFAQSVDRWTSYDNSENLNGNHMYFIIQKYFMFSFFLVFFKFFAKSVDRWTSSEKNQPYVFHY